MENEIIKCDICEADNYINTHYCVKCGNNLSNKIELTDILFFLSHFLYGIILVIALPFYALADILYFGSIVYDRRTQYFILFIGILILILIPKVIKKIATILCKNNLKKNLEEKNEKN